jgi:NitT/TauT family transport system ATP-binding protein
MNGHATLSVRSLEKSYGTPNGSILRVLNGISLEVAPGGVVTLVGPSGCGKSTLLNILAGIETADAGEVDLAGQPVLGTRGRFGYMFQADILLPWRSANANVALALEIDGVPVSEARRRATELLERVGLGSFGAYYPHELSGGMRQRVALLRTFLSRRSFYLFDEPFASVDYPTQLDLEAMVEEFLGEQQAGAVVVTHDIDSAIAVGDQILVLSAPPCRIHSRIDLQGQFGGLSPLERRRHSAFGECFRQVLGAVMETSSGNGLRGAGSRRPTGTSARGSAVVQS